MESDMSHLVCMDHKRRIMIVNSQAFHRSDGSLCDTERAKAGDKTYLVSSDKFDYGKET